MGHQSGYQPYQTFPNGQDRPPISSFSMLPKGSSSRVLQLDSLTDPTNYITSANAPNASSSRLDSSSLRRSQDSVGLRDEGRPLKRANYGRSVDSEHASAVVPGSPPSPEIVRLGVRRKRPAADDAVMPSSPNSSEDFPSDIRTMVSGPPKPRIVRGERPSSVQNNDAGLKSFIITYPGDEQRAAAAFRKCDGDRHIAAKLMNSPTFTVSSASSHAPTASQGSPRATGKNREYVETKDAERAAMKERGAKSAIYKQRRDLEDAEQVSVSEPSPRPKVIELLSSPIAPVRSSRTVVRRVVVDSDESEPEIIETGPSSKPNGSAKAEGSYFERKALESLNTFSMEELRELTGTSICDVESDLDIYTQIQ